MAVTRLRGNVVAQNPLPPSFKEDDDLTKPPFPLICLRADAVAPTITTCLPLPVAPVACTDYKMAFCQKLLFSETLTRDPNEIATRKYLSLKVATNQGSSETQILDVVMEKFFNTFNTDSAYLSHTIRSLPFVTYSIKLLMSENEWLSPLHCRTTDVFSSRKFSSSQQRSLFLPNAQYQLQECKIIHEQFKNLKVHV